MSTTERSWPKAIPGFSALKMKQDLQERVYRATTGMTQEEVRQYIQRGSEKFQKEADERRAKKQLEQVPG